MLRDSLRASCSKKKKVTQTDGGSEKCDYILLWGEKCTHIYFDITHTHTHTRARTHTHTYISVLYICTHTQRNTPAVFAHEGVGESGACDDAPHRVSDKG
jgi:hypothetical protein